MQLFLSLALLALLFTSFPRASASHDEDENDQDQVDDKKFRYCPGPPDDEYIDVLVAGPVRPPGAKIPEADPSAYKPFQILFAGMGQRSPEDAQILTSVFSRIDRRLSEIMRSPRLREIRLQMDYNKTTGSCMSRHCGHVPVSAPYLALCRAENGDAVSPDDLKQEIRDMNERQQYSVVIFVFTAYNNISEGDETMEACKSKGEAVILAFASVCQVDERYRPTHGQVVIWLPQTIPGVLENTIIMDPFPDDECAKFLPSMKIIAPNVSTMCPWSGAFQHYCAFDFSQYVVICSLITLKLIQN